MASSTSSPPPPPPAAAAIQSRLAHLHHYSTLSYITTHQSVTSNDPTVRLPRQEVAAQESHEEAVLRESEVLRERIREEKQLLSKLPPLPPPSSPHQTPRQRAQSHLNDLLTIEHLHTHKLSNSLPPPICSFPAPSPTSPLNPLLLQHHLSESLKTLLTTTIPTTRNEISDIKKQILTQETSLKTSLALTTSLQNRIAELEKQLHITNFKPDDDQNEKSKDHQIHKSLTESLESSLAKYTSSQRLFLKELSKFISTHLSPLLAAESLGGPVVGDDLLVEVDDDVIGFDKSGKPKRRAHSSGQRTIHDMFSSSGSGPTKKGKKRTHNQDSDNESDDTNPDDDNGPPQQQKQKQKQPQTKASKDLKLLLENLMNATLNPGNQYITLPLSHSPSSSSSTAAAAGGVVEVDSAAVRFLVRSNVAVLHPKDARRIRLVEFWRSVED